MRRMRLQVLDDDDASSEASGCHRQCGVCQQVPTPTPPCKLHKVYTRRILQGGRWIYTPTCL